MTFVFLPSDYVVGAAALVFGAAVLLIARGLR
jgi:hypothetical protein